MAVGRRAGADKCGGGSWQGVASRAAELKRTALDVKGAHKRLDLREVLVHGPDRAVVGARGIQRDDLRGMMWMRGGVERQNGMQ